MITRNLNYIFRHKIIEKKKSIIIIFCIMYVITTLALIVFSISNIKKNNKLNKVKANETLSSCPLVIWNELRKTDFPENVFSVNSINHVMQPNNVLRQSMLSAGGDKLYFRYLTWNGDDINRAWKDMTYWSDVSTTELPWLEDSTNDLPLVGGPFRSFDEVVLPNNELKQTLLTKTGKSIVFRYLKWRNNQWNESETWSERTSDLPFDTSTYLSYDHVMLPDGRLKQTVLLDDGITIFVRYLTWVSDGDLRKWENITEWNKKTIDIVETDSKCNSFDQVVFPNKEMKQSCISYDKNSIKVRYLTNADNYNLCRFNVTGEYVIGNSSKIPPFLWGINAEALPDMGADEFLKKYPDVATLGITFLRYPGGNFSESFDRNNHNSHFILNNKEIIQSIMSMDEVIKLADKINAKILYVANIETDKSAPLLNWKSLQHSSTVEQGISEVLDMLNQYGKNIEYIEIGNEPWKNWKFSEYLDVARQYSKAIRKANPNIKIGLVKTIGNKEWESDLSTDENYNTCIQDNSCFDFITNNTYFKDGFDKNIPVSLNNFLGKSAFLPQATANDLLIEMKATNSLFDIILSEWNLVCWGEMTPSIHTAEHGMFMLENFFIMAKNNIFGSNFHDLIHTQIPYRSGNCGLYDENEKDLNIEGTIFKQSSILAGSVLLPVRYDSPIFITKNDHSSIGNLLSLNPDQPVPYVNIFSAKTDSAVVIFFTNKHPYGAAVIEFTLNKDYLQGSKRIIKTYFRADDFTSKRYQIQNEDTFIDINSGKKINVIVPSASIVSLKIMN